ncbi:hypothetical protein ACET3Z_013176 [Daucus carota]
MLAEMSADGMGGLLPSRDENGLPVLSEGTQNPNPFVEKMKSKISDSQPSTDHQVFGDLPPSDNGSPVGVSSSQDIPVAQTPPTVGLNKPSWSSVVRNNVLEEDLVFDYCPMPSGVNVVTPPEEKGVKAPDLVTGNTQTTVEECPVLKPSVPSAPDQEDQVQPKISSVDDSGGEWTTVTNKKHSASSSSAIVGQVPEPLPIFKALSKSMSKGQLKRVRKATGKGSPNKK